MSMKLSIQDVKGAEVGEYIVPDSCIELERGTQAVHDVVVAFLSGQRAGTASTKTRAEVRGGGRKPFRQKGLGRARAGSIRSPIWVGGGITFGPKPRDFSKKVNKKVRKLALKRAFSERIKEGSLIVLDNLELADAKTKTVKALLDTLKAEGSVMLVTTEYEDNLSRATTNMEELLLRKASVINVYQLLYFKKLIFTKEALDGFIQRLA